MLYSRIGVLLWDTELTVKESFWNEAPDESIKANDNGAGYYVSVGYKRMLSDHIYLDLYLGHNQRNNIFEDSSTYPIDIRETLYGMGVGYQF